MDWPLSRAEKRHQVLQLYDNQEQMSDSMLMEGQAALARMKTEVETVKNKSRTLLNQQQGLSEDAHRLMQALESASAFFNAVVPVEDDGSVDVDMDYREVPRSKSAGTLRTPEPSTAPPLVASKAPRTPRSSLAGKVSFGEPPSGLPRRRVSFGAESEVASRRSSVSEPEPGAESEVASRRSSVSEPEPEESLPQTETQGVRKILDWGLTEFCAPKEDQLYRLGMHFKKLPPAPLNVMKVTPDSWAAKSGILPGDVLHSIAGKSSDRISPEQFIGLINSRPLKMMIDRPLQC